ncbi:MAG TPA: TetR/AcrR family transcriptional regulator [Candidatus Binatia bacterium]|nr:TetR/AcrR family transcriptional regulator [Candidatus Binatia bacterium]
MREVILDTAERLFAARGVDGVAVRDLAHEMGITASSLYNHFPGKQALYAAVLERGLGPIVDVVAVAWQDGVAPERVRATIAALTAHLARHPHLARLLQRALLEQESPEVAALVEGWVASLYREGVAVVGRAARDAGWSADEVPHLCVALFGMIFAYHTNTAALRRVAGGGDALFSARALAVQRRFLEKAVIRLLGTSR